MSETDIPTPAAEREPLPQPSANRLVASLARTPTFAAFQFREYRLLWLARVGNSISFWMEQVASSWLMYQLTDSPMQLGLVQAVRAIPVLFLSPLAGTFADRYGRKTQLVGAQVANAVGAAVMGMLVLTGHVEPWHVYAAGVVTAIAQVFQHPAQLAMIPETVDRARLTNAVGLNSIAFNSSRSIGPAIAGALIAVATAGAAYLAQAAVLLVSTIATLLMRVANRPPTASGSHARAHPSFLRSMTEGWRYVVSNQTIRAAMLVAAGSSLLGQPLSALLPVFARDVLDVGPTGQGFMLTAMGIGALCAGVLIATAGDRLPKGKMMVGGTVVLGVALVGFAFSQWFAVSLLFMMVVGVMNPASHALVQTVLQAESAPEMRARVMATWQQNNVLMTAGNLLAGALASTWGAPLTVAAMGSACAGVALAIYLAVPHVRTIR